MRADRLLSILLLLQARGRLTAGALAEELEVSVRTIYRDIDALSSAGVPVYTDRGPGGGISLLDSYRTTLTGLTRDQIRALFMLTIPAPLAELGLGPDLKAAMHKLAAALPAASRPDEVGIRQRIHLDPAGGLGAGEPVPHLKTLHEAVWSDRGIELIYDLPFGARAEWRVEPYGLVAQSGLWHLVARRVYGRTGQAAADPRGSLRSGESGATELLSNGDGTSAERERTSGPGVAPGLRVLRVSRLYAARILDEPFERPSGFDLADFWRDWRAAQERNQPRYAVRARLAPDMLPYLTLLFGAEARDWLAGAGPPDAAGWPTFMFHFESLEAARERLLGLGGAVEVLEPPALRHSIADFAAQVAALYGSEA